MDVLVAQLLNSLLYAAVLFLIAGGLSMIYGVMRIVNLAHGTFYALGAYVMAWGLWRLAGESGSEPAYLILFLPVAAAAVAYLVVIAGVVVGVLPWPTLIALVTIPLAYQTWKGLKAHYDSPYQLMGYLGKNVNLHLYTGLLLVIGVLVGILVRR